MLSVIIGVVHTSCNLRRDIWRRDVISRFENLPDGCLYWVNHIDPLAAAASVPDGSWRIEKKRFDAVGAAFR